MDNAKIELFGNLGKDVEARYTPQGNMVANTTIAVEAGSGDYKHTEWMKLTIWGEKYATLFKNMAGKGTFVWVSGTPKIGVWKSNDGEAHGQIEVNVRDFRILKNGKSREESDNPYDGAQGDLPDVQY